MIEWAELTRFIYICARMSGFVLFNPILGRNNLSSLFRTGLILMLSVSMHGIAGQTVAAPNTTVELIVRIVLELVIGFLLGMVVHFFFYIPQLAGSVVDTQMGLSMNQIYDAASQANMSVTGVTLNVLMMLLFFTANGHHTLLRIILTSADIVPLGAIALGDDVFRMLLELFAECTLLGVKLCMPILAAELLGQVGMGVLMKVIPQINVFAINIELKVIIGLGLLFLLIAPISEFLLQVELTMLESLQNVLALSG